LNTQKGDGEKESPVKEPPGIQVWHIQHGCKRKVKKNCRGTLEGKQEGWMEGKWKRTQVGGLLCTKRGPRRDGCWILRLSRGRN